jgi:DNA modification methylase
VNIYKESEIPVNLRQYFCPAEIGLEQTPDEYVAKLVAVFREARRVLRGDGTLWLNLGDSYSGSGKGVWNASDDRKSAVKETYKPSINSVKSITGLKPKNLIGIPWRVAFALQLDGWYLRQDIIWAKPNPMPESVTDRCTKAHEYVFLLTKSERYFYDAGAIAEACLTGDNGSSFTDQRDFITKPNLGKKPRLAREKNNGESAVDTKLCGHGSHCGTYETRNRRSVWTIPTQPCSMAHFAVMPEALVEPCILAGCPSGGTVLDPFGGSGTVGKVAERLGRNSILIELNPAYIELQKIRTAQGGLAL